MLIYKLFCFVYPNCIVFNIQDNRFVINVSRCLLCDILCVAASSRTSPMFSDNVCICFALVLFRSCVKDGFCEPVVTYVLMLVNTTSTQQPNCLASFLNIENGQKISRSDI